MDRIQCFAQRRAAGGARRTRPAATARRAMSYLTGGGSRARSGRTRPTLLTAAGMAWGIFETMQQSRAQGSTGPGVPQVRVPVRSERSAGRSQRCRPCRQGARSAVSPEALRIVRLAISAAYADGSVSDAGAGGDPGSREDGRRRRDRRGRDCSSRVRLPRSSPASATRHSARRCTCWPSAIVRGDEQPTGAERIYLAQLANLLGLDAATVQQLEDTAARPHRREPLAG